ncbi:MAG: hypothetical protein K2W99_05680 [Chthoniobacterales bacterium]|nr:hypothetical protein [Chthoniobacterales bacterium]
MKKLSLLLLSSALALTPLRVSAMMEAKEKKERKESGDSEKMLTENTDENLFKAQKKTAEQINNPQANNNTETKVDVEGK